jgi:hypothetical protein
MRLIAPTEDRTHHNLALLAVQPEFIGAAVEHQKLITEGRILLVSHL